MSPRVITSPDDPALAELCGELSSRASALDLSGEWPAEQLRLCGEYGVYSWFAGEVFGGLGWSGDDIMRGYVALSSACMTTAFVLTQREAACRRIEASDNWELREKLIYKLTSGESHATVGISQLTTSRRHMAQPVLRADMDRYGYSLSGYSAWVTGASHADYIVLGAQLMDGAKPIAKQLLAVVPKEAAGLKAGEPARLVALSASHTGPVHCERVAVSDDWLLTVPVENVMASGSGGGTGGLQTSALAVGLSRAALNFLRTESERRNELSPPLAALSTEYDGVVAALLAAARGEPACSNDDLRQRANSLVLRATQSALAAAKGAGYVAGHPAGRWCREALFFLVWSCPQPVLAAQMCELAGILE
jgi:alkylation response protein AidB-like acyl-CoA dehydrogenase